MIYSKRENAVSSKWPQFGIFIFFVVRKLSQRNFHTTFNANVSA